MALDLARWQFGLTTIFHFFFVPVTIGLSVVVAVMQTLAYRRQDETWDRLTRFFGRLFLINVAIGVVTGRVRVEGAPRLRSGRVPPGRPLRLRVRAAGSRSSTIDKRDSAAWRHLGLGQRPRQPHPGDRAGGRVHEPGARGAAPARRRLYRRPPGLLHPIAILGGLARLALFCLHGALFLALKTSGGLARRAAGRPAGWRSRRRCCWPGRWPGCAWTGAASAGHSTLVVMT